MNLRELNLAGRFLTRLPFPESRDSSAEEHAQAAVMYPVIGLILGLILWVSSSFFAGSNALIGGFILLAFWVWLSGGLHLDGLADSADAWIGGLGDKQRMLEIMKDPHIGSVAAVVLGLLLIGKWAGITHLMQNQAFAYLIWIPVISRLALPLIFITTPYAKEQGLGVLIADKTNKESLTVISAALLIISLFSIGFVSTLILLGTGAGIFWLVRKACLKQLGGTTGDTAGALVEITELGLLLSVGLFLI